MHKTDAHNCMFVCCADNPKSIERGKNLFHLQQKCRLSNLQTECVQKTMEANGSGPLNLREGKNQMIDAAGVKCIKLHGCIGKDGDGNLCEHVFGPVEKRVACPKCGQSRYQENGTTANEEVFWFPLKERLEALLKLPSFRRLLEVLYSFFERLTYFI